MAAILHKKFQGIKQLLIALDIKKKLTLNLFQIISGVCVYAGNCLLKKFNGISI